MENPILPEGIEYKLGSEFTEYIEQLERNQREHHRAMMKMVHILQ